MLRPRINKMSLKVTLGEDHIEQMQNWNSIYKESFNQNQHAQAPNAISVCLRQNIYTRHYAGHFHLCYLIFVISFWGM